MAPVVTTAGQDYGSAMAASGVTPAGCDFYDSWCNYCVTHAGSSLCAGYVARLAGSAAARPRWAPRRLRRRAVVVISTTPGACTVRTIRALRCAAPIHRSRT